MYQQKLTKKLNQLIKGYGEGYYWTDDEYDKYEWLATPFHNGRVAMIEKTFDGNYRIIGPYNNKEKPPTCPDEWWKDSKNWLPKEWLGVFTKDCMLIIPYDPLEIMKFPTWISKIRTIDDIIIDFIKGNGRCTSSEISSFVGLGIRSIQKRLSNLTKKDLIKVSRSNLTDPRAYYYSEESTKENKHD